MIRNYFKTAWRNLGRNKGYSFINIFGLALGMAVTLIIGLWIADEINHNSYFKNKSEIAQVYQTQTYEGVTSTGAAIPRPLEFALREEYASQFKYIVMASWEQEMILRINENVIRQSGISIQEKAPEMLGLNILSGDKNGLKGKNSIMISQSSAIALFGKVDPVGKIVNVNDRDDLIVTAVYKDIPQNNSFSGVKFLIPWKHYIEAVPWVKYTTEDWSNNSYQLFVQMAENTNMQQVSTTIANLKSEKDSELAQYKPLLFLFPMDEWHLHSTFESGVQTGGRIENIWLFGIIGAFVLLLACINFMNLSTARSEKRAMEVGIRKTIGSTKAQLVKQFLTESFLVVILAFSVAIGLTLLFLDHFNALAGKAITFPSGNGIFWIAAFLFIVITALVSGSYPALYLSAFRPIKVLKGTYKAGKLSALPRKILVVAQFSVSAVLIIGTLIVMSQIEFSKNRPIGYKMEGLIQIPVMGFESKGKVDLMRNQFITSGAVTEMAASGSPATDVLLNFGGFTWEGKPEGLQEVFNYSEVSYDFTETLDVKLVSGRGYSREFRIDSTAILLNQAAVDYMGLKKPVGKILTQRSTEGSTRDFQIIGVIEDIVAQSPYDPVKQALYAFDKYDNAKYWNLRLNPEKSVRENLATIEKVFKQNFPNTPFSYDFVDQEYAMKFAEEDRIASLAKVFTILAILISCLGLFGLASFVAEQRTKEIGVRKVLGASAANLWLLLSKEFVLLVVIALLIAIPIAYYLMHQWIQKFSYRTDISLWIFMATAVGTMVITLITVSFQSIKAALSNPTKSLRTE